MSSVWSQWSRAAGELLLTEDRRPMTAVSRLRSSVGRVLTRL